MIRPAILLLAAALLAVAVPQAAGDDAAKEEALDNLLSERDSPQALARVVEEARDAGVSEQAILEARFLYHVDRRDDAAIAAMLPEFLKHKKGFHLDQSAIFAVEEDWLAVVEYVQSIDCLQRDDRDGFKKHITEAFWLSPRQAAAFTPHIERMRLNERMRGVRVDFNDELARLAGGEVALGDLLGDRKAMLFHFWSPWSQECVDLMPDFLALAGSLRASSVAVVSIVPESPAKMVEEARRMNAKLSGGTSCDWLVDRKESSFNALFRVQSYPRMVLVSRDGSVLFNGEPGDSGFWQKLLEVDPSLQRPEAPERGRE